MTPTSLRGQQLQLVSQLLAVDPRGTDAGVDRFCDVAERLRSREERVRPSRYDEVALLALTQSPAAEVVDRVLDNRDRLREAKSRPDKSVAFTLAAGIELSADTERAGERSAGDLAALQSIQGDPGCPAGGDDRSHIGRRGGGRIGRSPLNRGVSRPQRLPRQSANHAGRSQASPVVARVDAGSVYSTVREHA